MSLGEQKAIVSQKHGLKQNSSGKIHDSVSLSVRLIETEDKKMLVNQASVPSPLRRSGVGTDA